MPMLSFITGPRVRVVQREIGRARPTAQDMEGILRRGDFLRGILRHDGKISKDQALARLQSREGLVELDLRGREVCRVIGLPVTVKERKGKVPLDSFGSGRNKKAAAVFKYCFTPPMSTTVFENYAGVFPEFMGQLIPGHDGLLAEARERGGSGLSLMLGLNLREMSALADKAGFGRFYWRDGLSGDELSPGAKEAISECMRRFNTFSPTAVAVGFGSPDHYESWQYKAVKIRLKGGK